MITDETSRTGAYGHRPPARGNGVIDVTCLIVRLIAAGHSPGAAEVIAEACDSWRSASPRATAVAATAYRRLWREIAQAAPEQRWAQRMSDAATSWRWHTQPSSNDRR
jgi:hypothetical protein